MFSTSLPTNPHTITFKLYKKCAQFVDTLPQNSVHKLPQLPHSNSQVMLRKQVMLHSEYSPHLTAQPLHMVLHIQFLAVHSVKINLCALSPLLTTTITKLLIKKK